MIRSLVGFVYLASQQLGHFGPDRSSIRRFNYLFSASSRIDPRSAGLQSKLAGLARPSQICVQWPIIAPKVSHHSQATTARVDGHCSHSSMTFNRSARNTPKLSRPKHHPVSKPPAICISLDLDRRRRCEIPERSIVEDECVFSLSLLPMCAMTRLLQTLNEKVASRLYLRTASFRPKGDRPTLERWRHRFRMTRVDRCWSNGSESDVAPPINAVRPE